MSVKYNLQSWAADLYLFTDDDDDDGPRNLSNWKPVVGWIDFLQTYLDIWDHPLML